MYMLLYSGVVNEICSEMKGKLLMSFEWYHYLVGAILIISSIVIIVTVMLQQSQQQGLSGAIAGGSDSFFDKNKGRTTEAKLAKITKIFAGVFFVLALAAGVVFTILSK